MEKENTFREISVNSLAIKHWNIDDEVDLKKAHLDADYEKKVHEIRNNPKLSLLERRAQIKALTNERTKDWYEPNSAMKMAKSKMIKENYSNKDYEKYPLHGEALTPATTWSDDKATRELHYGPDKKVQKSKMIKETCTKCHKSMDECKCEMQKSIEDLRQPIEEPVETRDEYSVREIERIKGKRKSSGRGAFGPMASSHKETKTPWRDPSTGKIHNLKKSVDTLIEHIEKAKDDYHDGETSGKKVEEMRKGRKPNWMTHPPTPIKKKNREVVYSNIEHKKVGEMKKSSPEFKKAQESVQKAIDHIEKGILGAGLGGLGGAALSGGNPLLAGAGAVAGHALEEGEQKSKKMAKQSPSQLLAGGAAKDPKATGEGVREASKGIREVVEATNPMVQAAKAAKDVRKAKPIGEWYSDYDEDTGMHHAFHSETGFAHGAFSSADKAKEHADELNRQGLKAPNPNYHVRKAVAEEIGSKYSPQQRKPSTDFGGESEVSGDGAKADVKTLQPSKIEKTN